MPRTKTPAHFTSTRLRGEVGLHRRCNPGEGVQGPSAVYTRGESPSPLPSPREERGEGDDKERKHVAYFKCCHRNCPDNGRGQRRRTDFVARHGFLPCRRAAGRD